MMDWEDRKRLERYRRADGFGKPPKRFLGILKDTGYRIDFVNLRKSIGQNNFEQ